MIEKYSVEERETHIYIDEVEKKWIAESSIPKYIRGFQRAGWTQTCSYCDEEGREIYGAFEAPAHAITVRKAEKRISSMTDEQKEAAANRLAVARSYANNSTE